MAIFNEYFNYVDLASLREYCMTCGTLRHYAKGEKFVQEGEIAKSFGLVISGYFKYAVLDTAGEYGVAGFAFRNEYVTDFYNSYNGIPSLVSIIAGRPAVVREVRMPDLKSWIDGNMSDFRDRMSIALFRAIYKRYTDVFRYTPKERYMILWENHPELFDIVSLRDIASYLRISPIYLSRLRKEIHKK